MSPSGVPASVRFCAGFSDAGNADLSARTVAGVGEAPRHEVAGRWAALVQRVLWRLRPGAELAGDVRLHRHVASAVEAGCWPDRASPNGGGCDRHRHGPGHNEDLDTRSGGAGQGPSWGRRKTTDRVLAHDVSILMTAPAGDARCRGIVPRSKISITIMRPPQRGHGHGSALG
jgi:hypothetical protein